MENLMYPVDSSNLNSIGYDAPQRILYIEFKGGNIYRYHPVGPRMFARLKRAHSKGVFFHQHIRENPRYEVRRFFPLRRAA